MATGARIAPSEGMIWHSLVSAAIPGSLLAAVLSGGLLVAGAQEPAPPVEAPAQGAAPAARPPQGPPGVVSQSPAPVAEPSPPGVQEGAPQGSPPAAGQQPLAPGAELHYRLERPEPLSRFTAQQMELLEKLNRVDREDLGNLREIVAPERWNLPMIDYSPLPQFISGIADHAKYIIVDLPGQVFGAYEDGHLVRWGPVNTGKGDTPTPPGLYHLNWKSRLHTSTENSKWKMPYYFNFSNYMGLGMHEYNMPGKPASHGCVRMLGIDAEWLFHWGEGWDVVHGRRVANGTPVLIVGQYHFGDPKPWLQPDWLAHGVQLPPTLMNAAS